MGPIECVHCYSHHYPRHDSLESSSSSSHSKSPDSVLNLPRECFTVSLGILTATCVLSGFTLIAFGQGMLLNTHRNNRKCLREVSLVKSEALLFHFNIMGTTVPINLLFGHTGKQ